MYIAKNNLYNQMKSKHVEVWMVLAQIDIINLYRYITQLIFMVNSMWWVLPFRDNFWSVHPTYILKTKIDVSNIKVVKSSLGWDVLQ